MENKSNNMGFNLNIPKIPDSKLSHRGSSDKSNNSSTNTPFSLIAKRLYKDDNIILAFKSLYNKYIDATNAPFCVNISSRNRVQLTHLLDSYHYQKTLKHKHRASKSRLSGILKPGQLGRMLNSTATASSATLSVNGGSAVIANKINGLAFIDVQFDEMVDKQNENGDKKGKINETAVSWLLKTLVAEMDKAARELSKLMDDTFNRFRRSYRQKSTY